MSIAPNYQGPTYVLYNTITNSAARRLQVLAVEHRADLDLPQHGHEHRLGHRPRCYPDGPVLEHALPEQHPGRATAPRGQRRRGGEPDRQRLQRRPDPLELRGTLFRWKGINYSTIAALRSAHRVRGQRPLGRSAVHRRRRRATTRCAPAAPRSTARSAMPGINDASAGRPPTSAPIESGTTRSRLDPPRGDRPTSAVTYSSRTRTAGTRERPGRVVSGTQATRARRPPRCPGRRRCRPTRRPSACSRFAELEQQRVEEPRAGRAERMAERDRAAVHVDLARGRARASFSTARYCPANASLISKRSTSSTRDARALAAPCGSPAPGRCP